jgi:hypothetical protein
MINSNIFSGSLIIMKIMSSCRIDKQHPVDYVYPFIGASTNKDKAGIYHGLRKTFPGAATPFGMVQLSQIQLLVEIMVQVIAMNTIVLRDLLLHR